MNRIIDLRSDTVTRPTPAMRRAMAEAEVGDDVYREDPTVNRLEERAAEIAGKEAALFVPTGTMGNTIGIKLNTTHGEEVICEARAHVIDWELAMMAWFAGCIARPVHAEDGILRWRDIEKGIRPHGAHCAGTGLVEIENTHNMAGGVVTPLDVLDEICEKAHERGLKVHMDGARVFNAAWFLGAPVSRILRDVDTAMFCLSKGLAAPVGSMLVGSREAMDQGRLLRKRLGGGMRQSGVLAAAGLIALEEMPARLRKDHVNAHSLAEGLAKIPGISVRPDRVDTNIVIFDVSSTGLTPAAISEALKTRDVLINGTGPSALRAVTHCDVSHADCEKAVEILENIVVGTRLKQCRVGRDR